MSGAFEPKANAAKMKFKINTPHLDREIQDLEQMEKITGLTFPAESKLEELKAIKFFLKEQCFMMEEMQKRVPAAKYVISDVMSFHKIVNR
jgi:hypothetical protein